MVVHNGMIDLFTSFMLDFLSDDLSIGTTEHIETNEGIWMVSLFSSIARALRSIRFTDDAGCISNVGAKILEMGQ